MVWDQRRMALAVVVAAPALAMIGGVLIVWGLLLGGQLGHLVLGGVSLALAVMTSALALKLAGMSVRLVSRTHSLPSNEEGRPSRGDSLNACS